MMQPSFLQSLALDETSARLFLARWFGALPPGGNTLALIRGVTKRPDAPRAGGGRNGWASTADEAWRSVQAMHRTGDDVYIALAAYGEKTTGSAVNVRALPWVCLDLDYGADGHSEAQHRTRDDALAALRRAPQPHMLVDSGGGFHAWWQLYAFPHPDEWAEASRQLLERCHGDPVTSRTTTVLRVPGTWNQKLAVPRPVRLLGLQGLEALPAYDLEAFAESKPRSGPRERAGGGRSGTSEAVVTEPSPKTPRARAKALPGPQRPSTRAGDLAKQVPAADVLRWLGRLPPGKVPARIACPIHGGTNRSSMVIGGDNPHLAQCFSGCQKEKHGGLFTAVDLVMALKQLSYEKAVTWIGERAGFAGFPEATRPKAAPAPAPAASAEDFDDAPWLEPDEDDDPPDVPGRGEGEREGKGGRPPGPPKAPPPSGPRQRPPLPPREEIEVHTHEQLVIRDAIAAMAANDTPFYVQCGRLIEILDSPPQPDNPNFIPEKPFIREVPLPQVRTALSAACDFLEVTYKQDARSGDWKENRKSLHVPDWISRAVHSRGRWEGMPGLNGIIECPTLRCDGSVITEPGFDKASGFWMRDGNRFDPVPEAPTRAQAMAAKEKLMDLVWSQDAQGRLTGFPFEKENHKAAWLAALLTPMARALWQNQCSPMFLFDANAAGAGKGLLLDVIGGILFGRDLTKMPQSNNPEEEKKFITSSLLRAAPVVCIDNVKRPVGGQNIESLLTSTWWGDRLLGTNDDVSLRNKSTWYATGNQLRVTTDMVRRVVYCRIAPDEENPAERDNFKYRDLLQHVHDHRAELAAAAMTILRGWLHYREACQIAGLGDPADLVPRWSSYDGWSRVVRGALLWLGMADPAETSKDLGQGDDTEWLSDLHDGWEACDPKGLGKTAAEIVTWLRSDFDDFGRLRSDDRAPFLAALGRLTNAGSDKLPVAGKLGYALRRVKDTVAGGRRLVKATTTGAGHVTRWRVETMPSPPRAVGASDGQTPRSRIAFPDLLGGHEEILDKPPGDLRDIRDMAQTPLSHLREVPSGTPESVGDGKRVPPVSPPSPDASPSLFCDGSSSFQEIGTSSVASRGRKSEDSQNEPESGQKVASTEALGETPLGASSRLPVSTAPPPPLALPSTPPEAPSALGPVPPVPLDMSPLDDIEEAERCALMGEGDLPDASPPPARSSPSRGKGAS